MKSNVKSFKNMVAAVVATAILLLGILGYIFDTYDYLQTKLFGAADYNGAYVQMIDVGQGDSILLYSSGHSALIDTGMKSYFGNVEKVLKLKGIDTLDMLLITHNHTDHMGGIAELVNKFAVKTLIIPDLQKTDERTDRMKQAIEGVKTSGGECITAEKGTAVSVGEFDITVIGAYYDEKDENDRSIVTMAKIGKWKFLFTGDAQEPVEKRLMADNISLKCDVLKVGHHGSMYGTSEEFLAATSPSLAMISCGKGNRYSHPHDVVLMRLKEAGVKFFRTDTNGNITFTVNEKDIEVTTDK